MNRFSDTEPEFEPERIAAQESLDRVYGSKWPALRDQAVTVIHRHHPACACSHGILCPRCLVERLRPLPAFLATTMLWKLLEDISANYRLPVAATPDQQLEARGLMVNLAKLATCQEYGSNLLAGASPVAAIMPLLACLGAVAAALEESWCAFDHEGDQSLRPLRAKHLLAGISQLTAPTRDPQQLGTHLEDAIEVEACALVRSMLPNLDELVDLLAAGGFTNGTLAHTCDSNIETSLAHDGSLGRGRLAAISFHSQNYYAMVLLLRRHGRTELHLRGITGDRFCADFGGLSLDEWQAQLKGDILKHPVLRNRDHLDDGFVASVRCDEARAPGVIRHLPALRFILSRLQAVRAELAAP